MLDNSFCTTDRAESCVEKDERTSASWDPIWTKLIAINTTRISATAEKAIESLFVI
jgi:acetyl/propionyl-CoA carboxylase alpha subunit